jgi:hypothetical protein
MYEPGARLLKANRPSAAADERPFNDGGAVTRRSHRPSQIFPRFAASDHEDVVAVGLKHA